MLLWIGKNMNLVMISRLCLFLENTFRETIFQTFLCLFLIRKVRKVGQRETLSGQRKIHSGQRKTLSSQFQSKKNLTWFSGKCFPFSCVCFPESGFRKSLSKLSCVCLPVGKSVNEKHFPVKGKFGLVFRKVFSWRIWGENTFRKLWKI